MSENKEESTVSLSFRMKDDLHIRLHGVTIEDANQVVHDLKQDHGFISDDNGTVAVNPEHVQTCKVEGV